MTNPDKPTDLTADTSVDTPRDGNHPDPMTLSEPGYDDQGLLRWESQPTP